MENFLPFDPKFLEPDPSEDEKALLDKFIAEYLKDFNPALAAQRVGFNLNFAKEFASVFMTKPYVQKAIMNHKLQPKEETEEDKKKRHLALIEATLEEACQNGSTATRVAATRNLMALHGFDVPKDNSSNVVRELVEGFKEIAKQLPD